MAMTTTRYLVIDNATGNTVHDGRGNDWRFVNKRMAREWAKSLQIADFSIKPIKAPIRLGRNVLVGR